MSRRVRNCSPSRNEARTVRNGGTGEAGKKTKLIINYRRIGDRRIYSHIFPNRKQLSPTLGFVNFCQFLRLYLSHFLHNQVGAFINLLISYRKVPRCSSACSLRIYSAVRLLCMF